MFKFPAVVALALLASVKGLIGGKDVNITNVPYQVYISHSCEIWDCPGAIISEFWIITTGQCATICLLGVTVHAGSSHRKEGGSRHTIASIKIHEEFRIVQKVIGLLYLEAEVFFNDIALIKVNEPFELGPTRRPIDLFNDGEQAQPGTRAVVSSWGDQESSSGVNFLRAITIFIADRNYCKSLYAKLGTSLEKQICARYSGDTQGMCFGDTGAPLVINGRLAGLFSWGRKNDVRGNPAVYTEISAYRSWIKTHSGI